VSLENKPKLKPEQATAAYTLDRHVSVTAGPGSGKTTVLVERYLHILRQNPQLNIDQIVAITFTNRAANEMRERLRKDLDRILECCSGDERLRWMRYKRTLDGAVINTIHGFCARLLREFPVEARIDPQFLLLDQHDAAILLEAAVEEALTELISRESEQISQLAVGFGRGRLAEALNQLYMTVRGQGLQLEELAYRTSTGHSTPDDYKQGLADLDHTINDYIRCGYLSPAGEARRTFFRSNWPTLRQMLEQNRPNLADYCSAIEAFRAGARQSKNSAAGSIMERLDAQLWGAGKQGPLGLVPQLCFDRIAKEYALEVIQALQQVEKRYREKKNLLAALDFDDLQLNALELLDQPAVLGRVTQRYSFFLIDEFQDTNRIQRDLMHKLAFSPRVSRTNLFIVGDRKQSIYGFRGADVDVFEQTTEDLKAAAGVVQPLHLNFRSQPGLISFFNYLFQRLFQRDNDEGETDLAELGFVVFEPSNEQREQHDPQPLVELLLDTKAPAEDGLKAEQSSSERDAQQIALRILSLTGAAASTENISIEENHSSSGTLCLSFEGAAAVPACNYRDIALLFRAMTDVSIYERVFRTANIPFQTVQGKGFYEREEISDLIQLLRFLDNRTDEIALAALLRSPLGGISDNALLALRCAPWLSDIERGKLEGYFSHPRKLFHALRHHNEIAYIDDRDRSQLERARKLLIKLIRRRNHYSIADLLRFAAEESEYLLVIAANFDGAQRLANVQKLFALAERFEHSGTHLVRDFVRYVEEFEAIGSRESEGQIDESANAVRLMSIHQAKGLEFPVVIIPNLHHRSLKPQEYWYALDRHRGFTLKVPDGRGKQVAGYTLQSFRERAKRREHFENVRLLYVAATRAENRLILSGATDDLLKMEGSPDNWLRLIWQKLELQVSKNSLINLDPNTQVAVTLNLADESRVRAPAFSPPEGKEQPKSTDHLSLAFPLLQKISGDADTHLHRFSVTQLINYRRCPRQYYFDRVLHLPDYDRNRVWNEAEAPEPPANLTATLKGAVIHRFCETYRAGANIQDLLRQSLAEVIKSRQAELADRLIDINQQKAFEELLPLAQNHLASSVFTRIERARNAVNGVIGRWPTEQTGLWSELSFRLRRPSGILTGAIDKLLITRAADSGQYEIEIIDFKTNRLGSLGSCAARESTVATAAAVSSFSATEQQVVTGVGVRRKRGSSTNVAKQFVFDFSDTGKFDSPNGIQVSTQSKSNQPVLQDRIEVLARDYHLQMQSYALAVQELLPAVIRNGQLTVTLHFLSPNVEYRIADELLSPEACGAAIDQSMAQLIAASEPAHFPVRPEIHCHMCNFLHICDAGRQEIRRFRRLQGFM